MPRTRRATLGFASAILAIASLGLPAAAADDTGTLAIVNGRPGAAVDICIGKRELSSGAPYGSVLRKDVIKPGRQVIRFFKRNDEQTCGGKRFASRVIEVGPGTDLTIVLTRRAPKVVVFDNTDPYFLGEVPPRGEALTSAVFGWRSAADFPADFHFTWWSPNPEQPISPADATVWTKGDEFTYGTEPDVLWRIRATESGTDVTLAQKSAMAKVSRRYEWILVGTSRANARFVLIDRGVTQPS
jgi:hypothetical protein